MAIQYVGGATAGKAGATSGNSTLSLTGLTGGIASAAAAGDVVVASYVIGHQDIGVTPSITDGTAAYPISATANANDLYDTALKVALKVMGSTPDTSVTFGPTGHAAAGGGMAVQVWRGVDPGNPLDVAAVTASGGNTGRPNPAAITPVATGAVVIAIGAGASAGGAVFTAPALSNFISNGGDDTVDAVVGMGSFAWSSGSYDPAQFTGGTTGTDDSWSAVTLALRPIQPITGALAKTLAPVILSSAGQTSVAGTLGVTLAAIALASASQTSIAGTLTRTLGPVGLSATAREGQAIDGALSVTLGPVTLVAAGQTSIAGTLDIMLGSVALAAAIKLIVPLVTPADRTWVLPANKLADRIFRLN